MSQPVLYQASYRLLNSLPDPLWVDESLLLVLEITNHGAVPWFNFGRHPINLSYAWFSSHGTLTGNEHIRIPLPHSVPPGQRTQVEVFVAPPPEAGTYRLHVDLVEEGMTWFAEQGCQVFELAVTYRPATVRRVCLINGNCIINDAVGGHVVAQLRALRAAGYHVMLLTEFVDARLPADVRRLMLQLHLHDLHTPDWRTAAGARHFFAADVVIVNYSTYYELVHAIKLVRNSAIIFDYHGVTPPALWDPNSAGYNHLVQGQQHVTLVEYADYAYGHSRFTADELVQTGRIPPGRVGVMPYAVLDDTAAFHVPEQTRHDLLDHYRLHGCYVLLYVGRMARNKRIQDLVEALALVRREYPDTVLLLVGDNQSGPYQEYTAEVWSRAVALDCQQHVIFTGQVPDLQPYYDLCHLFVTASIHEGFGMPAVEAMAHGRPVVAANVTASPYIIGSGGLFFTPEDPADLALNVTSLLRDVTPHPVAAPLPQQDSLNRNSLPAVLHSSSSGPWEKGVIGFVTPRYGPEIIGGAERLIRGWTEELALRGYPVEVLTTCTARMEQWANHYTPGVEEINGVTVRRFTTSSVDPGVFHNVLVQANAGAQVGYSDEQAFMRNNLQSDDMNAYLRANHERFACVFFAPYLFGTTYWGMQSVPDKALVVPCMHDEPIARFAIFREMLEGAAGIFFNTQEESEFTTQALNLVNPRRTVIGYGFDPSAPSGDGAAFRTRHHLPDELLLYSGRLEVGKNVPLLLEYFMHYKAQNPGPLTLVLTGTGDVPIPDRADIRALGILPEEELPDAFAAALALCQPSLNESFSIVMMEAWLQNRPVLVHAHCPVTSGHVNRSGGGFTFHDYDSFASAIQQLYASPARAMDMGRYGRLYVVEQYSWDRIIGRVLAGVDAFIQTRSTYDRLAQQGVVRSRAFTYRRYADALLQALRQAEQVNVRLDAAQRQQLYEIARLNTDHQGAPLARSFLRRLLAQGQQRLARRLGKASSDPVLARQEQFNREVLYTLLPLLEKSLSEQRRLQRDMALLRAQIAELPPKDLQEET